MARNTTRKRATRTAKPSPRSEPKRTESQEGASNTQKDPATWKTGDEPMTGAQASYLKTISEEVGEEFDGSLTKAEASERIDTLRPQAQESREGVETQAQPGGGDATASNTRKDPDDWTTGGEPMTGAQASYLQTLSEEAKEPFDTHLTKAEASKRIDELQEKTGRGRERDARG